MTVHERDCAPCDAARAVVDELAAHWDPIGNWDEVEALDGHGGTLRDQAVRLVADVLHRYPLPAPPRRPT
ncbi:hypothetical protein [Prauserella muralis]|uniref:Uncharacterized protein n=1 Tax=Prauserella muralis TaxID=588067 RepID=A0A2V4B088_9PSEU|nr:hypothetical protein [Prauserella muralis]PXY27417.1 hypothetical protein BAY60_13360 [Prauserella muralis]TWE22885.1 hypothetical protein FHX69_4141 [Prauserella muralis]